MNFRDLRLLMFDLDGTLVDSIGDIVWCGNAMMKSLGLPPRNEPAATAWVGNGVERFVKRFLTGEMGAEPEESLLTKGLAAFRDLYSDNSCRRSEVYPGVIETLQTLAAKDFQLACVTNKAGNFTTQMLTELKLSEYFSLVVSGDTTARIKPDPMPLLYAVDHFNLKPEQCLMIGDSSNDVLAARAANIPVACVPYGYNHGIDIKLSKPDLILENISDLGQYID